MKITFVYHSCYVVEFEEIVLVFDYFKGKLPVWNENKEVYFFTSHKHHDHFSMEILKLTEQYKNITFVLSNDIKFTDKFLLRHGINPNIKEHIIRIGKNETLEIFTGKLKMKVETLRSTDEGVAFLITYNDKVLFHAGDLHWWSWAGESDEEYLEMSRNYTNEINKLTNRNIDVAFIVLDPRQEERYWWGMDYFMKATNARKVFPMHCWEKYWIIKQFQKDKQNETYCERLMNVEKEGDFFIL